MTKKIAISLPDELVDAVKRAVASGEAPSVSAFIADSIRARTGPDPLRQMIAEFEAEHGAFTDEERAWADEVLNS